MQCSFIVRLMDRLYTPSAPESGRDCFTHARHTHPFRGLISAFVYALLVNLQPWESNRKTQMKISAHRTLFVFIKPWQYLNIWSFTERISKLSKTRLMWTDVLIQIWISRSSRWVGTVSLIGRLYARAAHCVVWMVWTHFCYYALCKTRHISTGSDRGASTSESERERSSFHAVRLFFSYKLTLVYFVFSVSSTLLNTQCGAMLRNWLRKLL